MKTKLLRVIFTTLILINTVAIFAQKDSLSLIEKSDSSTEKIHKRSYIDRLLHGNVDRTFEKKMDISFVASPSYTREASFGIGGMASGLYRLDRKDSIMSPSDITLTFNASVFGFYAIGAKGNNYFKGRKSFLTYDVFFSSKPLDFWGISYNDCNVNPVINYTRQQIQIDANYKYKMANNLYVGAVLDFNYTNATKIDNIDYLNGEDRSYLTTGIGASIQYDSRDFIPNPQKGVFLMFKQTFFPKLLGSSGKTLSRTTFVANTYQKIWSGGILAFDLYGQFNSNDIPWTLKEQLGGNQRMRGYYAGRYIDNNIVVSQIELRQHLAQRLGCTFWFGGGTVFPTLNKFEMKHILPTYGIGFRWEFKHNLNARIDYGFGKQTAGFVFNIAEAF